MDHFDAFLYGLLSLFALSVLVHAQSQSGFISIDCGLPEGDDYTDPTTGINYVSDASFVETGTNQQVSSLYQVKGNDKHLLTLRSFPEGIRNCYTIRPEQAKDNKFLIRTRFLYGNYDSKGKVPAFDVYLGTNLWLSVKLGNESTIVTEEIIHVSSTDYIQVCLVNTGSGTPLISSLELRLLKSTIYKTQSQSLMLFTRFDIGSLRSEEVRYKDDIYDRKWLPHTFSNWAAMNTSLTVDANNSNDFHPPLVVMQSAARPANVSESLQFFVDTVYSTYQYYVYMHFAETEKLQVNQTREFNIFLNGSLFYGPLVPDYLSTTTVYSTQAQGGEKVQFSINRTERSTLPPMINAIEIYTAVQFLQSDTDERDTNAILNIKSSYEVKRNWQGDPCAPRAYIWDGLNCSYDGFKPPKIIALNLSSSGLKGQISLDMANLTSIRFLDLSDNSLTGTIPDFLSQLPFLKVLNLKGNNLTGPIPPTLLRRSRSGALDLSVDGGPSPSACTSTSCGEETKRKTNFIIPVVASIAAVVVILVTVLAILLWRRKRGKQQAIKMDVISSNSMGTIETRNRQLTFDEVVKITNNFERMIGKGGFGTVYYGLLDGTQVAVKMLSPSSVQGYQQFQAEVKLLMRVHHRNLTTLIGYCNEDTNMALIYEYMANGDLGGHLSDESARVLSWEERLRIAVDTAQGLEYLHHGCKPPIVHRDIKSTNILLDDKFQAKLADFGLSRIFPNEGATSHVSTVVAGTPGYLDPEYYVSNRLNEKSDVYSFGVVLLEIISKQRVITRTQERVHISQWVSSMLAKGDVKNIIDQRLREEFDINSLWKAIEVAMLCVSSKSTKRPPMNDVAMELKACLEMESARKREHNSYDSKDSTELTSMSMHTEMNPLAR